MATNIFQIAHTRNVRRILVTQKSESLGDSLRFFFADRGITITTVHLGGDGIVDMMLVGEGDDPVEFLGEYHRCRYVWFASSEDRSLHHVGILSRGVRCVGGELFSNDFFSLPVGSPLSVFDDLFVRDVPHRFLLKVAELFRLLKMRCVVEIGGCTSDITHGVHLLRECCTKYGHSTAHWCLLPGAEVHSVDLEHRMEEVINSAYDSGSLSIKGKLHLHVSDGMTFLHELGQNVRRHVDLLYLDAFTESRLNQRAIELAQKHLARTHLVCIGNADTDAGKVAPFMRENGYITLTTGRVALYFKGDEERLVAR